MDLTKDFFFSYSYHVMHSVQKNLCYHETGQILYENMFVWNEFLTRGIRNHLKTTLWTIALVYGFFKQVFVSFLVLPAYWYLGNNLTTHHWHIFCCCFASLSMMETTFIPESNNSYGHASCCCFFFHHYFLFHDLLGPPVSSMAWLCNKLDVTWVYFYFSI